LYFNNVTQKTQAITIVKEKCAVASARERVTFWATAVIFKMRCKVKVISLWFLLMSQVWGQTGICIFINMIRDTRLPSWIQPFRFRSLVREKIARTSRMKNYLLIFLLKTVKTFQFLLAVKRDRLASIFFDFYIHWFLQKLVRLKFRVEQ